MTRIISSEAPAPANPPVIDNLPFWPEIDLGLFLSRNRLTGTVTPDRAAEALQLAVIVANRELAAWRQAQEAAGYPRLELVPGDSYDAESARAILYRVAVHALTKSNLTALQLRDFDSTGKGHQQADQLEPGIDALRQQYREALAAIQGKPRATVELI